MFHIQKNLTCNRNAHDIKILIEYLRLLLLARLDFKSSKLMFKNGENFSTVFEKASEKGNSSPSKNFVESKARHRVELIYVFMCLKNTVSEYKCLVNVRVDHLPLYLLISILKQSIYVISDILDVFHHRFLCFLLASTNHCPVFTSV